MNKILIFGDDPTGTTGFGRLVDGIVSAANNIKDSEVTVVGLKANRGEYKKCKLINAVKLDKKDANGNKALATAVKEFDPDLVITVGDPWDYVTVPELKRNSGFIWCSIVPVECPPYPRYIMIERNPPKYLDVLKIQKHMDYIVTYSEFAIDEITKMFNSSKEKVDIPPMENIYLFVNNATFKEQETKKRDVFNLLKEDDILFTYIKVNSQRAGFDTMIEAWKKYLDIAREKDPDIFRRSKLYLRTFPNGPGYNLSLIHI